MKIENSFNISERLKLRRSELGLSLKELSDISGVSASTLQRYETGKALSMPLSALLKIAPSLRTTPRWIIEGGVEK